MVCSPPAPTLKSRDARIKNQLANGVDKQRPKGEMVSSSSRDSNPSQSSSLDLRSSAEEVKDTSAVLPQSRKTQPIRVLRSARIRAVLASCRRLVGRKSVALATTTDPVNGSRDITLVDHFLVELEDGFLVSARDCVACTAASTEDHPLGGLGERDAGCWASGVGSLGDFFGLVASVVACAANSAGDVACLGGVWVGLGDL